MPPKKNLKSYRKGRKSSRKTMVAKKAAPLTLSGIRKLIDYRVFKKAEPKHIDINFGKTELNHNTFYSKHINDVANMPIQGSSDFNRIGDQISLGGFYVRMLCGQKRDRPNVTWRFLIVKVPKGQTISYNTVFDNVTGNVLLDNVNKDNTRILKSLTYKPNMNAPTIVDATTTKEFTFPIRMWVPYKKTLKFLINSQQAHDDGDIYIVTMCYDAYGTLITDNICYVQQTVTMYWKDP